MVFLRYSLLFNLLILLTLTATIAHEGLIHEPYWQYDENGLRGYAKRILKTISPYMIDASDIDSSDGKIFIYDRGNFINVRKVNEFGRVLPNIFLRQSLASLKDSQRAVPKIFLLPKETDIEFKFLLPHQEMKCNSGHNCIQVLSDSFEIFQEFIPGRGQIGDRSFADLGHADFNQEQIIKNIIDGKKYLIDTKEKKNFFLPAFYPYTDPLFGFAQLKIGRNVPLNSELFVAFRDRQQESMIKDSLTHFGPKESVTINLGPLSEIDLSRIPAINYSNMLFDDELVPEPYSYEPRDNLVRYLFLGRADLASKLLDRQEFPLKGLTIPTKDGDYLNPVQFILGNEKISKIAKFHLLSHFSKEKQYFLTDPSSNEGTSPLYQALATGDRDIFLLVAENGANINTKVGTYNILATSYQRLLALEGKEKEEALFIVNYILKRSNEKNIKKALNDFLFYDLLKGLSQEERAAYIKELLAQLPFIDGPVIKDLFFYNNKEIIESILAFNFDYRFMLQAAVGQDRFAMVKRILEVRSNRLRDEAIDQVFADNLLSQKTKILCEIIKHLPKNAPKTLMKVEQIKKNSLDTAALLQSAAALPCPLLVEYLAGMGLK